MSASLLANDQASAVAVLSVAWSFSAVLTGTFVQPKLALDIPDPLACSVIWLSVC